jgi:hypothetical protein
MANITTPDNTSHTSLINSSAPVTNLAATQALQATPIFQCKSSPIRSATQICVYVYSYHIIGLRATQRAHFKIKFDTLGRAFADAQSKGMRPIWPLPTI